MRDQGKLTDWDDDKGFGFVTPQGGGLRAFVHIRSFSNRPRRPRNGDLISYRLGRDPQGRARAENVLFQGDSPVRTQRAQRQSANRKPNYFGPVASMFGIIALAAAGLLSWLVPLFYFTASTVLFIIYAFDKSAAMNQRWRVPESHLHLLAFLGGWPGGLVAQAMFHHKSKKIEFRRINGLMVLLNTALLAAIVFELDHRFLQAGILDPLRSGFL